MFLRVSTNYTSNNLEIRHILQSLTQTISNMPRELKVYKVDRFKKQSILDVRTHFKPTETFQYTHFNSCHPPGVRKGFIKGEALRLLRTNSSKAKFEDQIASFKQRLRHRGYPDNLLNMTLSEVNFSERMSALQNKQKTRKRKTFKHPPLISYRKGRSLKDVLVRAKL